MEELKILLEKHNINFIQKSESFIINEKFEIFYLSLNEYRMHNKVYTIGEIDNIFKNALYTTRFMLFMIIGMTVLYFFTSRFTFIIADTKLLENIPKWLNTFLHGNIVHLVFNMATLAYITRNVKYYISFSFYTLMTTLLIIVSILYPIFSGYSTETIGFSCVLYGMFVANNYIYFKSRSIIKSIVITSIYLIITYFFIPYVDNLAHLVGLITGVIVFFTMFYLNTTFFKCYFID